MPLCCFNFEMVKMIGAYCKIFFKLTTHVPSSKIFDLIIFKLIPLFWQSLVPGVKHMALLTSFLLLKNLMHRQQEQKYTVDWWILEPDNYDRKLGMYTFGIPGRVGISINILLLLSLLTTICCSFT